MRIACVGGGPAGLHYAILMKQLDPRHDITVIERNRPFDAFGWGVVFSDDTLAHFADGDAQIHRAITERFVYWTDMDVLVRGEPSAPPGTASAGSHARRSWRCSNAEPRALACGWCSSKRSRGSRISARPT